jgi:signal transduction histidine kinase
MVATQDFVASEYHICKASGQAIMAMGYPVFDADGNFIRVINISIDLSWLNEIAAQADLPPGSTLAVFDYAGHYLTHYPDPQRWVGKVLAEDSPLYPLFSRGEGTLVATGPDGIQRIYATTPMEDARGSVKVVLGIPTAVAYAEANRTTARNLLLLGTATLLAALAAAFLAEVLIMRRTRALLQTTQQLANGDLSARTTIPHDAGELGQLASSFDLMADTLEQRALERDRAEHSMREYAAELERSNRELQDFANVASHDMQEPLRKILTFSELLQTRYATDLDERGKDYLQRMDNAATRLHNLINDLLAYSRVTTRAQPFVKVNLNEVARKVLSDLDLQIEESRAKVELTPLPTLEADPTQMHQLLQNLVGNALKYHQPGQPPQICISAPTEEAELTNGLRHFQVRDQGIGFDEKYLDRIFQPFQRLHRSNEFEGTGMGLAICRKIVERHGGSISAHSAPGQGTTFTVSLPAKQNSGGTPP